MAFSAYYPLLSAYCLEPIAGCFLKLLFCWPIQRLVNGMRSRVWQGQRLMRECEEFEVSSASGADALETALKVMSTPPSAVSALNHVLGASPIDLLQLGGVGRCHPGATTQILKLCNSSIFRLSHPVSNLEQAVVSLGAEVLRTLGLAWGLVDLAGKYLPASQAQAFWQHGLTLALLSERIAERMDYPVTEAYLAGFLHDIGRIPILMAAGPGYPGCVTDLTGAAEYPEIEICEFGADHCDLGRRIGISWDFSNSLVEVFGRHHRPDEMAEDIELVRIVSAAERFCSRQPAVGSEDLFRSTHDGRSARSHHVLNACFPDLETAESLSLAEVLEFEFLQSAQRLKLGVPNRFSPALRG